MTFLPLQPSPWPHHAFPPLGFIFKVLPLASFLPACRLLPRWSLLTNFTSCGGYLPCPPLRHSHHPSVVQQCPPPPPTPFLKWRMTELLWKSTCQNRIKMFSLLHCLWEMNGLPNHRFQIYIQFGDCILWSLFPSLPGCKSLTLGLARTAEIRREGIPCKSV